jgi:hypothetical protein
VNYGSTLPVTSHSTHAKTLGWKGTDLNQQFEPQISLIGIE